VEAEKENSEDEMVRHINNTAFEAAYHSLNTGSDTKQHCVLYSQPDFVEQVSALEISRH